MDYFTFAVSEEDKNSRLDSFLSEEISEISRSMIQKLIVQGNVLVCGKKVNKNYKLRINDVVTVNIPEPESLNIKPQNISLDILFEDDDVVVIDKPQDMVVHPAPGHYEGTLVNALLYHCGENLSGINGVLRPGIIHRIDKDTSGVLVIAKTNAAHQFLALQLAEHSMTRIYNAVVYNNFSEDFGTIDKPVGRHPVERKKMAVTEKNSRRAVTHYRVLKRMGKFNLLELKLETGRTHQIRVHMAYIGHPLLGDTVYGPKKQSFNLKGQALHARVLGFVHPRTNEYMEFESPLPDYFNRLIEIL